MVVVVYQVSNLAPIALISGAMFLGQIYSTSESETQSFRYFLEISLSSFLSVPNMLEITISFSSIMITRHSTLLWHNISTSLSDN